MLVFFVLNIFLFNFFCQIHLFVCIFLYKMHIWYMVLIFYKIFIFSFKKWLLYLKLYVFGRFFSKKATWSQKSLNLMKLLKTLVKVHKNDFFFHFWIFLIIIISEYTHPNIFLILFLESASNSTLVLKILDVTYVPGRKSGHFVRSVPDGHQGYWGPYRKIFFFFFFLFIIFFL